MIPGPIISTLSSETVRENFDVVSSETVRENFDVVSSDTVGEKKFAAEIVFILL
jgi:hypothetical protein